MIPRIKLAHLPTPIESLTRLSEVLEGPQILVKRDDQTGLAFGGNKTRKLEYLLADAQVSGAELLITGGAVQSNHCRQTAAAANKMGFNSVLVLVGERPENVSGNLLLNRFLGAGIVWAGDKQRDLVLRQTYEKSLREGKKPYLIPYGGSNVLGASAYTFAMQEMLDQNEDVDWVVFASSSGGTQAGLVVGAQMFGYQGSLLGISIDEQAGELKKRVATLAGETAQFLGIDGSFSGDQVLVNDDYLGDGYGIMGEAEVEALQLFSRYEGLFLDPVYTGRAAAGMIDLIRKGFFSAEERVLFWHTGGTPALFANPYVSQLSYGLDG